MDGFAVRAAETYGASDAAAGLSAPCRGSLDGQRRPRAARAWNGPPRAHRRDASAAGRRRGDPRGHEPARRSSSKCGAPRRPAKTCSRRRGHLAGAVAVEATGKRGRARAQDLGGLTALGHVRLDVAGGGARSRAFCRAATRSLRPARGTPARERYASERGDPARRSSARAASRSSSASCPTMKRRSSQRPKGAGGPRCVGALRGSSVSARDHYLARDRTLGRPGILVHGIALRPGKPTMLAIGDGKPVIGLPGNPASALVVAWRIVRPFVRLLLGSRCPADGLGDARRARRLAPECCVAPGTRGVYYVPLRFAWRTTDCWRRRRFRESSLIFTLARSDG